MIFYPSKVQFKSESPEAGFSTEEIACAFRYLEQSENVDGKTADGWKIAFNAKYLADFFLIYNAKRDDPRFVWKFGVSGSQTELKFEGEEQLFSYVLVPLKV